MGHKAACFQEIQVGTLQNIVSSEGDRTVVAGGLGFVEALDREDLTGEGSGGQGRDPGPFRGSYPDLTCEGFHALGDSIASGCAVMLAGRE